MDYDTMRELVPVFCMNPRLHDEALLSIPIGQAWRYLRDNEFDVLDSQTVLYRHKGYGGHWFLREPFQAGRHPSGDQGDQRLEDVQRRSERALCAATRP